RTHGRQLAGPWWGRLAAAGAGLVAGAFVGKLLEGPMMLSSGELIVCMAAFGLIGALAAVLVLTIVLLAVLHGRYLFVVGAAALAVYLFGWFLVGWLRDTGTFGSFLTVLLVMALMLGPVVVLLIQRLVYEFSDRALALVLERRYPQLLGDRLITA